jgi:hypothetical protein
MILIVVHFSMTSLMRLVVSVLMEVSKSVLLHTVFGEQERYHDISTLKMDKLAGNLARW